MAAKRKTTKKKGKEETALVEAETTVIEARAVKAKTAVVRAGAAAVKTKTENPNLPVQAFLQENKSLHFNTLPADAGNDYKVSMGSILCDEAVGGLEPGVHRFLGPYETGKTSCALEVMRNFLNDTPDGKGVYVKAEGRLSEAMRNRSGIQFVERCEDLDDWVPGTAFVLKTNLYNTLYNFIDIVVHNNPEGYRYCIVVDSVDGLELLEDKSKGIDETLQVAGPATLNKRLMKRYNLPFSEFGHIAILISQASTTISTKKSNNYRKESASGGHGLLHFANWILDFKSVTRSKVITKSGNDYKEGEVKLGHWCEFVIQKSPNEKTFEVVKYPIRHANSETPGGVWKEIEVIRYLLHVGVIKKAGAWYSFAENCGPMKQAVEMGIEVPPKMQGEGKLRGYFEDHPELTDFWHERIKRILCGAD